MKLISRFCPALVLLLLLSACGKSLSLTTKAEGLTASENPAKKDAHPTDTTTSTATDTGTATSTSTSTATNTSTGTSSATLGSTGTLVGTSTGTGSSTTPTVKVSFVLTNDIHGHLSPTLTTFSGILKQLRALPEYRDNKSALFLLDSGDQFQGTLPSNYNEGESIFKALNQLGYDAIIPGNHDYDFGPIGWLWDKSTSEHHDGGPRGVIEKLQKIANFPLLSANTFYKSSLNVKGSSSVLAVDDSCKPANASTIAPIDFSVATRPAFLKPYVIIEKAGVRVALIGIDHHLTTSVTTADNVKDLCFRDEAEAYVDVRKSLEGQADVFVILMHNGDVPPSGTSAGSTESMNILSAINTKYPGGVDLVAAGHTHRVHNNQVDGVHDLQDGANAQQYGRVDLFFDPATKKVVKEKTASYAGVNIDANKCSHNFAWQEFVCSQISLPVTPDAVIDQIVAEADLQVAPIAKKKLATAKEEINVSRTGESALGNILTDALRKATGTQVAIMNSGGIRTSFKKGDVLYENLFEVSPFQNLAVVSNKFPWSKLKNVLESAAKTCGEYGTLEQSGLKIEYTNTFCDSGVKDADRKVELTRVALIDGTVLIDSAAHFEASADQTISITTLDFLSSGSGDGYAGFGGMTIDATLGIARDLISDGLFKDQPEMVNKIDNRFKDVTHHVGSRITRSANKE